MRTLIDGGDRNSSMSSRPSGSWEGLWQAFHVADTSQVQPSDAQHNEVCVCVCKTGVWISSLQEAMAGCWPTELHFGNL